MNAGEPHELRPLSAGAADALEYEILQEKAATLGRLTQRFEMALAAFDAANAADLHDVDARARRDVLLDAAGDALWNFVVQREICGLRNTEAVLREYQVPAVLRLRMGVTGPR